MRVYLMLLVLVLVAGPIGFVGAAGAAPFEIGSSTLDENRGTYQGQTFTVDNDPVISGSNSCAVGNCFLLEWTWQINTSAATSTTSPGNLFVDIYDLDGGSTYLGSSTNSIDVVSTASQGDVLTWSFDSLPVDPTHVLIAEISFDSVAGNAASIRLDLAAHNVSGNLTTFGATPISTAFDSIYTATLVPEPGTAVLLGLGMAGLGVAGRRERRAA